MCKDSSAFIMFGTVELLFSFNSLVFEEVICTHVFILMQRDTCHGTCKIEMLFLRGIISVYGLCDGLLCE